MPQRRKKTIPVPRTKATNDRLRAALAKCKKTEDIEECLARAAPAPEGALIVVNDGTVDEGAARLLAAIDSVSAPADSG